MDSSEDYLRFGFFAGPTIMLTSLLLKVNMPRENLPTLGAPIPLSLFKSLIFGLTAFSRMIPLSLASRRLLSSLSVDFATMPFRWANGIFC